MAQLRKNRLSVNEYVQGIRVGNRLILSRAITLVESHLPADVELSQEIVRQLLPDAGRSQRIGITGVPGVGKSTFIESFGKQLTARGKKVAILAIDPSSQRSKGSILGDKTRMEALAKDPLAYIRPSPAGGSLGGITRSTRQAILLCEAAGYGYLIVETVGVGQSETAVRDTVDFFLLLMLAGAGDELQGIKRGIIEMADALVITKADGSNQQPAQLAQTAYKNALHLFPPTGSGWQPPVLTCSAITGEGIPEIHQAIEQYVTHTQQNDYFSQNRRQQNLRWMHAIVRQLLEEQFYNHPQVNAQLPSMERAVTDGNLPALTAALQLLRLANAP